VIGRWVDPQNGICGLMKMGEILKPFLPYARQNITDQDVEAVVEALRSDWLTQGPAITRFEAALAEATGAREVVACASGTAALHLAMLALGLGPGDTVVTSANTFVADANCARYVGADVIFADVDPDTGNMTPDTLAPILTADVHKRIKAVIPVHFAGQPVDLPRIHQMASQHGATVVDDACHALGASYESEHAHHRVGSGAHSKMTVLSFHPVKHVATGEGGAVATNDNRLAERLRLFRTHGISRTAFISKELAFAPDGQVNPWYYEMQELGYNYRLTDIQAALGVSQLSRLSRSVSRRNELALHYHRLIEKVFSSGGVSPLQIRNDVVHAYHLFVVQIDFARFGINRAAVMNNLRSAGIGTQVHYIPVPLQPYYRELLGAASGAFPGAERYYVRALSLPMYPDLVEKDVERIVDQLQRVLTGQPSSRLPG
jgi:UDP-4-amino-4,6-dideoxy-N-acetyl-beta-L-altrosamine transaminase